MPVNPDEAVGTKPKPKNKKKGTGQYEGVKLYTDVSGKDIKQTKKQLLKELAMTGNSGLRAIANDATREGYAGGYDREDIGVNMGTTDATLAAIDEERQRMLGGLEVARNQQGGRHSKAMDRMSARNVAYADSMKHAAKLSKHALKKEIAAMKLAYEQAAAGRGGGGGGGGGGGSTGGYQPSITGADQSAAAAQGRLAEIYFTSASALAQQGANDQVLQISGEAVERNPDATLAADQAFQRGMAAGYSPTELTTSTVRDLQEQGLHQRDALAIAHTVGQNYGTQTNFNTILSDGGGAMNIAKENVPGMAALAGFLERFKK